MATELGKAYVQIVPSARGIKGSITKELGGEVTSSGKKLGAQLGGTLMSALKTTVKAGAAGVGAIIAGGVLEGGKLEQSIGGTELLFKESADRVVQNAKSAFKTAGISANQYLETSNAFAASLLQGLAGNTQEAAEYANLAIQDMADNAAAYGTDIQRLQDAYRGFARGEYMMLDNLLLGYGGTASEMARLVNEHGELDSAVEVTAQTVKNVPFHEIIQAIHNAQDSLGLVGHAAMEADETLQGAFNSMKSSFLNAMGAISTGDDVEQAMNDLAETTATFLVGNFIPMIGEILSNIPEALVTFIQAGRGQLENAFFSLMNGLGIPITEGMYRELQSVAGQVGTIFQPVLEGFRTAFGQIPEMLSTIGQVIGPFIQSIGSALANLDFSGIRSLAMAIIPALTNAFSVFMGIAGPDITMLVESFVNLWNAIQPVLSIIAQALMPVLQVLAAFLGGVVKGALFGISAAFDVLAIIIQALTPIIQLLVNVFSFLTPVLTWVAEAIGFLVGLFGNLGTASEGLRAYISSAFTNIQTVIAGARNIISSAINSILDVFIHLAYSGTTLKDLLSMAWSMIRAAISSAGSSIVRIVNNVKSFFTSLGSSGNSMRSVVSSAWNSMRSAISNAGQGIKAVVDTVISWFNSLKNIDLRSAGVAIMNGFLGGLKSAWGKVKDFFGGIGPWIKNNKGPIEYDRRLLIPAGRAIMQGLDSGLQKQFETVKDTVTGMAPKIAEAFKPISLMGDIHGPEPAAITTSTIYQSEFNANEANVMRGIASIQESLSNLSSAKGDIVLEIDGQEVGRLSAGAVDAEQAIAFDSVRRGLELGTQWN